MSGFSVSGITMGWSQKRKLSTPLSLSATAKKLLRSWPSTRATRHTLPFHSMAPALKTQFTPSLSCRKGFLRGSRSYRQNRGAWAAVSTGFSQRSKTPLPSLTLRFFRSTSFVCWSILRRRAFSKSNAIGVLLAGARGAADEPDYETETSSPHVLNEKSTSRARSFSKRRRSTSRTASACRRSAERKSA